MSEQELYVARKDDLETLTKHWESSLNNSSALLLTGELGSGKRALVGQLARNISNSSQSALVIDVVAEV